MTYDYEKWRAQLNEVVDDCAELLARKQADYGPTNIANAPGGPINGLRVRMYDKLARISNLYESGAEPENEALVDSFMDLANYGIIGVMVLRGQWPGAEFETAAEAAEAALTPQEDPTVGLPLDGCSCPLCVARRTSCGCSFQGPCWDHR